MFRGVALQVTPELVAQGVFAIDLSLGVVEEAVAVPCQFGFAAVCLVQDFGHGSPALGGQWLGAPVEADLVGLPEADDHDAFAMLRYEVGAVDDAGVDVVAEIVERALDDVEGAALVVRHQIFDVFEQEGAWLFFLDDAADVKEQRALRLVGKSVGAAEGVLFGNAGNREGLAGKAAEQDIVVGDVGSIDFGNVAVGGVAAWKVLDVGLLRVGVPFAGEHALTAEFLKGHADAADAGEQVDEAESGVVGQRQFERQQTLQAENVFLRDFFIDHPVAHGAGRNAKVGGYLGLRVQAQRAGQVTGSEVGIGSGVQYGGHGFPFCCSGIESGNYAAFCPSASAVRSLHHLRSFTAR